MKLRKRLRRIPEALMVVLAQQLIPLLPRRAVVGLSRFLGWATYRFSPKLRQVAAANLELVFGDSKSPAARQAISRASFGSFALVLLDLFWFGKWTGRRIDKYMRRDSSFEAVLKKPSVIIVSLHLGNWEMLAESCGHWGYPLTSIAMPVKNRFVDKALQRLRSQTGSEVVPREGALRAVIKSLKNGRGTAVGIDQNTLPNEGGVFVPFFGLPVPVVNILGVLLARGGSKIAVSWCVPNEKLGYTIYAREFYPPNGTQPSREEITAHVTQAMESIIMAHPGNWLWSYKRWRFYRDCDDALKFPFYSESYEGYLRYRELRAKFKALQAAGELEAAAEVRRAMQAESQAAAARERERMRLIENKLGDTK